MTVPHDVAMKIEKMKIAQVLDALKAADCFDDDELKLDMLEAETDVHALIKDLLDGCEEDETIIEALKLQVETRNARKDRLNQRIEARRAAIMSLLNACGTDKFKIPEATLSLRKLGPRPIIQDAAALPDHLVKTERKPDAKAIKEAFDAGDIIPGVVPSNGGESLTIRRR
jgi:seryl-tRNA(Sec) selenium transferase